MARKISKKAASELWDSLREALVNAEDSIKKIIAAKAWEPLGYDTFLDAWADRMQGVRLATNGMAAHVVYQMLSEGASDADIATAVTGVGGVTVRTLREKKGRGIPPENVNMHPVRRHERRNPAPPSVLKVELTAEEIGRYKALARVQGSATLSSIVL